MQHLNEMALRPPMIDWEEVDKYQELCNFEIEVKNIFITHNYNTQESESISVILKWLIW